VMDRAISSRWLVVICGPILTLAVSAADAQVSLSQTSFESGVNFAAFFNVRGCGDAATTALRVEIPTGVGVLELPEKPGWLITAERNGNGVAAVTWQSRQEAARTGPFGLLVKLPATPGPLYFPAVQRCGNREIRWTDMPPGPVAYPAPTLMLVAAAPDAPAHHPSPIVIERPWARATPPGAQTGAAYLTITNHGTDEDVLVAASSPQAERVEFHQTTVTDGVMKMRPATRGVTVPAHGTVELKPDGGYHLMLGGLKAPLRAGTTLPVTLRFAKAGRIDVVFAVEPIGARAPSAGAAPDHLHP
jgi:copper(I)-binding protein